jgi:hypothetical protein
MAGDMNSIEVRLTASTLATLLLACACGETPSAELKACAEVGKQQVVRSIVQSVDRLNALPQPVSPACFVASLDRPVEVVATSSVSSAQPASGPNNPRIFLRYPGFTLSVVADGPGGALVEFSEGESVTRTLKGEVELPWAQPQPPDAPFTRVNSGGLGVTSCGLCHRDEEPHPSIAGAFVSDALRPMPNSLVPLAVLQHEHQRCLDANDASARCVLYHALFDFGPLTQGAFPQEIGLFH